MHLSKLIGMLLVGTAHASALNGPLWYLRLERNVHDAVRTVTVTTTAISDSCRVATVPIPPISTLAYADTTAIETTVQSVAGTTIHSVVSQINDGQPQEPVTNTVFNTLTSTAIQTLNPDASVTASSPFSFIDTDGTISWIDGRTPPVDASLTVLQTTTISVIPLPTPAASTIGAARVSRSPSDSISTVYVTSRPINANTVTSGTFMSTVSIPKQSSFRSVATPLYGNESTAAAAKTSSQLGTETFLTVNQTAAVSYSLPTIKSSVELTTARGPQVSSTCSFSNSSTAAASITSSVSSYNRSNVTTVPGPETFSAPKSSLANNMSAAASAVPSAFPYSLGSISTIASATRAASTTFVANTTYDTTFASSSLENYSSASLTSAKASSMTTVSASIVANATSAAASNATPIESYSQASLTTVRASVNTSAAGASLTESVPGYSIRSLGGKKEALIAQANPSEPGFHGPKEKRQVGATVTAEWHGQTFTFINTYSPTSQAPWLIWSTVSTKVSDYLTSKVGAAETSTISVAAISTILTSTYNAKSISSSAVSSYASFSTSAFTTSSFSLFNTNSISSVPLSTLHSKFSKLPNSTGPSAATTSHSTTATASSLVTATSTSPGLATASCVGEEKSTSTFTVSFDDLPTAGIAANSTSHAPLQNPYHNLMWSQGYSYVPNPADPYIPHSGKRLGAFLVSGNDNVHSSNFTGKIPSDADVNGMFGSGPKFAESAFWFDAYSFYIGCGTSKNCSLEAQGYQYDASNGQSVLRSKARKNVTGCDESSGGCELHPFQLGLHFRNLTAIQIVAREQGSEVSISWYVDDILLSWSNNTCDAVQLRDNMRF